MQGTITRRGGLSAAIAQRGRLSGCIRAAPLAGTLRPGVQLSGRLSAGGSLAGAVQGRGELAGRVGVGSLPGRRIYPGPFAVTPTREQQVLTTRGYELLEDVVVEPIPPNYGRITRVGMSLRVD